MKYVQKKLGGGAGFILLILLLAASSAFAQTTNTRYIDPVNGKTENSTCVSSDPTNANGPCTLARAYEVQSNGDMFLVRVLRAGSTVMLAAPTAELTTYVTFGAYVRGGATAPAVAGTLEFTGNFKIARKAQVKVHKDAKVHFADVTLTGSASVARSADYPFFGPEDKTGEQTSIAGTLTIDIGGALLKKLVVSKSFTVKGGAYRVLTVEEGVTIHRGATLTLGTKLYVPLRKGASKDDTKGILTVDGVITSLDDANAGVLAIMSPYDKQFSRGDGSNYIPSTDYDPSDGVDHTDCVRITGSGSVRVGITVSAGGNICMELKEAGDLTVTGSIEEGNDARQSKNISTDFIFRNDVVVDGNVEQWNDARVVFEKRATVKGNVIVEDGATPNLFSPQYTLAARGTSARKGVQMGTSGNYTCGYLTRRTDKKQRAAHIPGVQFEGAATIEGDLDIRANTLTETTSHATQGNTACAPRVLFMAPEAKSTTPAAGLAVLSSIGGDLAVEDTASFGNTGRVYLDSDMLKTGAVTRRTAHNVQVGGDLVAKSNTIGMASPSTSSMDGMCTGKDLSLSFGNHLVLTDATESVIIGDATNGLTLGALVTHGDLRVESGKGPLTVTTLHVGSGAELMSTKDVKVTESLILQGELSGELDEASTIKKLTYGSRTTDVVKKAALTNMLDALAIHVGSGELRLDEVVKAKNLGLCSGTLSLVDVESTTDSTLHVTEQITVQNGMLEKDTNDPGSLSTDISKMGSILDRYVLTYITPGKRTVTDALEWFDPRDVIVNHAKAEITTSGDRSIVGKLTITKGKLMVDGMLTVGTSTLNRKGYSGEVNVDRYSVVVTAGELHTEDMVVQGRVTVKGKSKLMTGGGDLHVLGRVIKGEYAHNTAMLLLDNKESVVDLGDGALMLGPVTTTGKNLRDENGYNTGGSGATTRPDVLMRLMGSLTAGQITVPKGSKETVIDASSDSKTLAPILFDGTRTPGTGNHDGLLRILSATAAGKELTIDSLSAMQGSVETRNKKVVITDAVSLRSATIWPYTDSTEFMGDLVISGTGGLNTEHNDDDDKRIVKIHGNFTQTKGTAGGIAGVKLHPSTTKTVMGDLMVALDASGYAGEMVSGKMPTLIVHGSFHFAKNGKLNAAVEFKGDSVQEVMTGDTTALHSITVNNAKGLLLKSDVMQQKMATLTLRQGKIHSMPMDSMFMWTVQNVQVEQELRGRNSAQEGEKCGADNDEACKASILRGSRQSYVGGPVARHLLQGNAGAGFASGGYLFPVGMEKGDMSHYRPLILQLPSDLTDTTAVTVSPIMVPEGAMPDWENLTVPTAGGSLTLDVHADLFWKVDLGTESLPTNTNLRIAAEGIPNVADANGLRIVQWDCVWKNPKLAGRHPAQAEASSFAVNGYINGVVNLTQEGIGLGTCAIFGVAANRIENPIDQADLSGGQAMIQLIHNLPLTTPVDVHLGEVQIRSGLRFREATAYRPVGAGSHELKIQATGMPAEQAITSTLELNPNTNTVVIAHGSLAEPKLKVLDMRMASSVANKAEVRLVHGSADLGAAQVQVMDLTNPMMPVMNLANSLMLGEVTRRYFSLDPSVQVVQVKSADGDTEEFYELNLYGYAGQTLVLNLSGMRNDRTILGVDRNGEIVPVQVVTGVEESVELPKEFALHGNYPNPFNPGTRIQFDLPENAQVQVQIVDMLGREVITLPAQELEAGANRSVELNASSLASGTYLYRIMATGAEQRYMKTGRMTLVK